MSAPARFTAARAVCVAYENMTPVEREAARWNSIRLQIVHQIAYVEYELMCGQRTTPEFIMTFYESERVDHFTNQIKALAEAEGLNVEMKERGGVKFTWAWV